MSTISYYKSSNVSDEVLNCSESWLAHLPLWLRQCYTESRCCAQSFHNQLCMPCNVSVSYGPLFISSVSFSVHKHGTKCISQVTIAKHSTIGWNSFQYKLLLQGFSIISCQDRTHTTPVWARFLSVCVRVCMLCMCAMCAMCALVCVYDNCTLSNILQLETNVEFRLCFDSISVNRAIEL